MQYFKIAVFVVSSLVLGSCSMMTKVSVGTMAPSLEEASISIQYEHDWDHFKESIISQVKILELLHAINPESKSLLTSLVKGHSAIGFGYFETLYLADAYQDKDHSVYKAKASDSYSRSIHFAKKYFTERGVQWSQLERLMNNTNKFNEFMNDHFGDSDLVAVFYTTQSLASLINLNRDKVVLMSKLNLAVNMLNWVCGKKPDIEMNTCTLFQAGLMASRPKMLGGNPKEAARILKRFFKNNPNNALAKVFYLQYISIPQDNKKEFNQYTKKLNRFFYRFDQSFIFPNKGKEDPVNLFNAIAKKRLSIMKKYKKEIF